jgi:hypothetical protein
MKHLNLAYDDAPHAALKELKKKSALSWESFFLMLAGIDSKGDVIESKTNR